MKRAWFALIFTPIVVAFPWALASSSDYSLALVGLAFAVPIMLFVTGIVAVPLFLALRRRKWLLWWHALVAGCLAGLAGSALLAAGFSVEYVDSFGPRLVIGDVGLGGLCGLVFWWIGIFRNRAFPFVSTSLPLTMIVVVPIAIGDYFAYHLPAFEFTPLTGRVVGIAMESHTNSRRGLVEVKLTHGPTVEAEFIDDRPYTFIVGHCWHLGEHWSTRKRRRIFSLNSPFGGGVDDC